MDVVLCLIFLRQCGSAPVNKCVCVRVFVVCVCTCVCVSLALSLSLSRSLSLSLSLSLFFLWLPPPPNSLSREAKENHWKQNYLGGFSFVFSSTLTKIKNKKSRTIPNVHYMNSQWVVWATFHIDSIFADSLWMNSYVLTDKRLKKWRRIEIQRFLKFKTLKLYVDDDYLMIFGSVD